MPAPSVHIVILNWNGWEDTIECLETVLALDYPNVRVVLVDNGSENDSVDRIGEWATGRIPVDSPFLGNTQRSAPTPIFSYSRREAEQGGVAEFEHAIDMLPSGGRVVLIRNGENLGFAGGSNVGIRYALAAGADHIWLLNNDTAVLPDTLRRLMDFMEAHPGYNVATGQIRYYHRPDVIWNCGGMLTWYGMRKYDYVGAPVSSAPQAGFKRITYVTGCAALYRASFLQRFGILSERFFFGEEDFEMALRTRRLGCNVQACVYDAILYHKVGASIGKASRGPSLGKPYVHYLNRFIDLKHHWPRPVWQVWRVLYLLYILPLLKVKFRPSWSDLWKFTTRLLAESARLDGVDRETFRRSITALFPSC